MTKRRRKRLANLLILKKALKKEIKLQEKLDEIRKRRPLRLSDL